MTIEEIERYDWNKLKAANDASLIPLAIIELASSSNEEDAQNAYWKIDNNAVKNEMVYQAALPTIYCILSVLPKSTSYGRAQIFNLLYSLGAGYVDLEDAYLEDLELLFYAQCRLAIKCGVSQYFYFLENGTTDEKRYLADLLELCSRDDDEIKDRTIWFLERLMSIEKEPKLLKAYKTNLDDLRV